MKYDGEHCPKCGGDILVDQSLESSGCSDAYQVVSCSKCDSTFVEHFKLVGLEEDVESEEKPTFEVE
jgi:predicted nucleic-acid-binding Zn-ribbon protein